MAQLTLTARLNTSALDSRRGVVRLHPEAIAALGRRAGITAAVVECRDGLAAVDVDKPSDLDFVRAYLAGQPTAA